MNKQYLLLILSAALLALSCRQSRQAGVFITASEAVLLDTIPGSCPFATRDAQGNPVISWVRQLTDTSGVLCYAVSADNGQTFGAPVVVTPSGNVSPHAENLPKVLFKPSGEILAVWGTANPNPKNKYSGLVYYAQSFDAGRTWSAARPLVQDTAGFDQRYFDVALLSGGEAVITWLDNRKDTAVEGSALYLAQTSGRNGFSGERRIAQSCCQCCRTDLFIDHKDNIHVLYRGILQDSIRDMVHIVSEDRGRSFSGPDRIAPDNWVIKGCPHTGPAMTEGKEGLHFAWYTGGRKRGSFYTQSADNGRSFRGEDSIASSGKHPQITTAADGSLLIVWDEAVKTGNRFTNRIGLQQRTADGKGLQRTYLTPDSGQASHPVITPAAGGGAVLAFVDTRGEQKFVKRITVEGGR